MYKLLIEHSKLEHPMIAEILEWLLYENNEWIGFHFTHSREIEGVRFYFHLILDCSEESIILLRLAFPHIKEVESFGDFMGTAKGVSMRLKEKSYNSSYLERGYSNYVDRESIIPFLTKLMPYKSYAIQYDTKHQKLKFVNLDGYIYLGSMGVVE